MAQAQQRGLDPLQMLMDGADRLGNAATGALGSLVGFAAQSAPGALAATAKAGADLYSGVNDAVRDAAASIVPSSPSMGGNPFAGLNLCGINLAGCSVANDNGQSLNQGLGDLSAPMMNFANMRSQEACHSR